MPYGGKWSQKNRIKFDILKKKQDSRLKIPVLVEWLKYPYFSYCLEVRTPVISIIFSRSISSTWQMLHTQLRGQSNVKYPNIFKIQFPLSFGPLRIRQFWMIKLKPKKWHICNRYLYTVWSSEPGLQTDWRNREWQ